MDGTRARALLGVSAHATPDELRQAFRRRARSTHPDCGGDATHFDETVVAFRSLVARPPVVLAPMHEAAPHVPFDRYDVVDTPRLVMRRRDTFAEVLQRVVAA